MESFTISLNQEQLDKFDETGADIAKFLNDLFPPFSDNYRQLTFELQREFKQSGSPDVERIAFDRVKYDATSGKGSFRVVLDISFTFGCEDVRTEKEDQTSEWTFAIQRVDSSARFYSSPFAEGRSTADEF